MPRVQAVPLSNLSLRKVRLQNDGGAIVLRGMQPAARTRLRSHTCRLRGVFCHALEIGEVPPAADEASRFRGSGTIGAPNGRGNRNAATVTAAKNGSRLFAPCAAAWAAVSGFAALRMPHPPCGEKSATLISRPRGAGIWGAGREACLLRMSAFVNLCCFVPKGRGVRGQDWWIFAPNESVLF